MSEMKVALKGLTCANCAGKIEDTLSKLSETQEVSINLLRQEMTVKLAPNASAEEMQETVERVVHKFEPEVEVAFLQGQKAEHHHAHHEHCGCGCEEDDDDDDCCACGCGCGHDHAHGDENVFGRKFFLRFGIGLAFFLAAVFLHEGTICTILYICAYLIFGYDVLLRAAKHIGQGKVFDENFLMSFSTIGALYLGEMAEAVFVMLFYQVGEAFQEYAVARSRKSITALLDIRPDFAHLIVDDEERKVDPSLVQVGDMILVKAGERFCLNISEESLIVETFHSTDEGVAFWLSCEGKEIYHAGDLNNWWWEGEDMAWNRNMAASYKQEMKKLSGRTADLAFIPVDPRQEQWFYLGAAGFMEQADTKWIFPMHFWEDYTIIPKLIEHPSSEGWRDRIVEIHKEGEEFIR